MGNYKFPMSHERYISIPVQVTIFPHEWLSRRDEIQIWGICILSQLLSHEWGKIETRTGI